jgi:hypothetical protein
MCSSPCCRTVTNYRGCRIVLPESECRSRACTGYERRRSTQRPCEGQPKMNRPRCPTHRRKCAAIAWILGRASYVGMTQPRSPWRGISFARGTKGSLLAVLLTGGDKHEVRHAAEVDRRSSICPRISIIVDRRCLPYLKHIAIGLTSTLT